MVRVVIVGAGITGMTAAFTLRREAPEAEITVLERDPRLGGKVQTERVGGFVIEGGPDSFLTSKPGGLALCRALGMEDTLEGTRPERRRTFVLNAGQLFEMPQGLSGLVPSQLTPLFQSDLFSVQGKLRMAMEVILPRRAEAGDESLGGFMRRRFGGEAYERLIEPLMSGIYGGNGDQLSLQATFPQLGAMEQRSGSLIRGIRASRPQSNSDRPKPAFVTPIQGMAKIIEALERSLPQVTIQRGTPVAAIRRCRGVYGVITETDQTLEADAVIVAVPSYVAATLLRDLDGEMASVLTTIPYASTATVSLAYPSDSIPDLPGYGYVVPRAEGRPVLACTWTSSKFAHRAPEGYSLLRAFVGRAGREEILEREDDEVMAIVREELREVIHIEADPVITQICRWPAGMPQYTVGHLDRVRHIEGLLTGHPGLFLAGAAYRGVGIPDCITSGERVAREAARFGAVAVRT